MYFILCSVNREAAYTRSMITDRHTNLSYKVTALSKDFFLTIMAYLSLSSMIIEYLDIVSDSLIA